MTPEEQHLILFWIFVGFFVLIGIVSLLSIVGVIPTERQFRKWAITGFGASIISVVIFLVKLPIGSSLDINVNLIPPEEVKPQTLVLVSGTYKYTKQSDSDELTKLSNNVELVSPQESSYWTAKFPYLPPATGKASRTVTLTLIDNTGHSWEVQPFYPNFRSDHLKLKSTQVLQNDTSKDSFKLNLVNNAFAHELPKKPAYPTNKACSNYPNKIKFNNWTKLTGKQYDGRNYYTWRVFVDEDESILNCIEEVQYILHPTFPNPLQIRRDSDNKFAVEMSGWGVFSIDITVKLNNGAILNTNYTLDFTKPWPVIPGRNSVTQ